MRTADIVNEWLHCEKEILLDGTRHENHSEFRTPVSFCTFSVPELGSPQGIPHARGERLSLTPLAFPTQSSLRAVCAGGAQDDLETLRRSLVPESS